MTTINTTYEVNANGNRSFGSESAASVARVAATWLKQGHEPKVYAKIVGDQIRIEEVPVTTATKTKLALKAAR